MLLAHVVRHGNVLGEAPRPVAGLGVLHGGVLGEASRPVPLRVWGSSIEGSSDSPSPRWSLTPVPRQKPQWGTADAEIKNPLVGDEGYQRFPLFKPGVGI